MKDFISVICETFYHSLLLYAILVVSVMRMLYTAKFHRLLLSAFMFLSPFQHSDFAVSVFLWVQPLWMSSISTPE
jgi:hypothetical protein